MDNNEFRILCITIFGLCALVITLGIKIELLKNELDIERNINSGSEVVSAVSDSVPDGGYCCMERLR